MAYGVYEVFIVGPKTAYSKSLSGASQILTHAEGYRAPDNEISINDDTLLTVTRLEVRTA